MLPKLGILAGGGELPRRLIHACQQSKRPYFVLAFKGQTDPQTVENHPHAWVRLGQAGLGLDLLHQHDVEEVVLTGAIKRPNWLLLWPDFKTLRFFLKTGALALGDDGLLRAVARQLERQEGFKLVGIHTIMPELLVPEGVLTQHQPDETATRDIEMACHAALQLGQADIGQGACARGGEVIAREDKHGTDAMLARLADSASGKGGVLCKMAKPRQEMRIDLPTIGAETVRRAAQVGLSGIAVEAGAALIVDRDETLGEADRLGIFIVGLPSIEKTDDTARLVYFIAGEESGDALGAGVMRELNALCQGRVRFAGIGGDKMKAQGLDSLFSMEDLAVMGVVEVLPKLGKLIGRLRETVSDIRKVRPDCVVSIDAPDFCLRVAKQLKDKGEPFPIVHYVAPSVWAWRPKRAKKISKIVDHLLALLPFEPPYFEVENLPCTFVGHPAAQSDLDQGDGQAFRSRHAIGKDTRVVCILPGSRRGELARLLPVFGETVTRLHARYPDMCIVVPTLTHLQETVLDVTQTWPVRTVVVDGTQKADAFCAANAALAASGTVGVELAVAQVPSVIAYKINPLTFWAVRHLVKVRFVNLINIVLDREAVPEFIQENCRADVLAVGISTLLDNVQTANQQRADYKAALKAMGRGGESADMRAAKVVLSMMEEREAKNG